MNTLDKAGFLTEEIKKMSRLEDKFIQMIGGLDVFGGRLAGTRHKAVIDGLKKAGAWRYL